MFVHDIILYINGYKGMIGLGIHVNLKPTIGYAFEINLQKKKKFVFKLVYAQNFRFIRKKNNIICNSQTAA